MDVSLFGPSVIMWWKQDETLFVFVVCFSVGSIGSISSSFFLKGLYGKSTRELVLWKTPLFFFGFGRTAFLCKSRVFLCRLYFGRLLSRWRSPHLRSLRDKPCSQTLVLFLTGMVSGIWRRPQTKKGALGFHWVVFLGRFPSPQQAYLGERQPFQGDNWTVSVTFH